MNVNKVVTGLLVLLLFLTGCGKQQKIENSNKDGGKVDDSVENMQVQTLYNTRAQWEILDGCLKTESEENIKFSGDYSYAVSDLDNDGNIEIILSGTIENGLDSRNLIFEYCAKDKIVQWDTTHLACKDSEPDFRNQNELWTLKDYEYDVHFFLF